MSAQPVLLLHGQPGSASDWSRVIGALDGRVRAIAVDRPGWDGRSVATDLDGNARAALAALDEVGGERAVVVGHSFGGAVAAWLAASHPRRVQALVLAAPSANLSSLYASDRLLAAPGFGHLASAVALSAAGGVLVAGPLRRRIAPQIGVDDAYLQTAARRLLTPAAWRSFVLEQRVLLRDLPVLEERLARIEAPTTIIAGSRDPVVPGKALRELAQTIPGAELTVIPGAGHLLAFRQAGRLAEAIVAAAQLSPGDGSGSGSVPGVEGSGTAGVGGSSG